MFSSLSGRRWITDSASHSDSFATCGTTHGPHTPRRVATIHLYKRKKKRFAKRTTLTFRMDVTWVTKNFAHLLWNYVPRSKAKTNRGLLANVFLHFASTTFTYVCFEFWLVSLDCLCPLWLARTTTLVLVLRASITHVRVYLSLSVKARASAQLFIWKWV